MPTLPDNVLLIGVDGGASEVKAHQVLLLAEGGAPTLSTGPASAATCYERLDGFEPLPVAQQLVAFQRGEMRPSDAEVLQGEMWVEAAAGAILSVASQAGTRDVVLGMCMPGLKTKDGRGVAVMKNGPRMPEFCAQLERELASEGLRLVHPIRTLASDGEACAWGEECDVQGHLRGAQNAYYIGSGTGVAEAFKLGGEILGLDALKSTVEKAWQMEARPGVGFEELLSMRAMNERYAARAGLELPLAIDDQPERRAAEGDAEALAVLAEASDALAQLGFERIRAVHAGHKPGSRAKHPRPGTMLDRIVLGQHIGRLFARDELAHVLRDRTEEQLSRRIEQSGSLVLCTHYLEGGMLRSGFLTASTLRAAPAIGAAALALLAHRAPAREGSTRI
ncbi:MAG: hypothetical protein IPJ77_10440 [Planctomycetes bacterium]|nr:hypothetical protein [Planctomycetota bacterium]